jgi:hypothetical protein
MNVTHIQERALPSSEANAVRLWAEVEFKKTNEAIGFTDARAIKGMDVLQANQELLDQKVSLLAELFEHPWHNLMNHYILKFAQRGKN